MIQFITKKNKNTISFTGVVNTFADLPDPTLHNSEFWIVKTSSGFWVFGRKEAGTYYSNGATWERLGQWDIAFRSDNFEVYDSVDNTKALKFDTTGISAGVDRTYTAPDKNGTLALLSDVVSPAITKEPTCFKDPENVIVTYDNINRTITLTGTVEAYYQGQLITALIPGWVSAPHPAVAGYWYLLYDGSNFTWQLNIPWKFYDLQIAGVPYGGVVFGVRDVHGAMQWETHEELHNKIGTYRFSGGDLTNYTINSTVAANRRPDVSQCTIKDEDLPSVLPTLTTKLYTQHYLSGATGDANFLVSQADIVPLNGNIPYYNQFNGANWVQTPLAVNQYMSIWIVAVPVTADSHSQQYRFVFMQGQAATTNLATEQARLPETLNLGNRMRSAEFVFITRIIIRYTAGNWQLIQVDNLTGSRFVQVSSPAGNYLTSVSTDINSITGSGVATDPLKVSDDAKISNSLEIGYTGNNTAALSVYEDGFNPNWPQQGINNFTASDSVFEATFTGFKARGTMAAKTAVQQGDYLGTYSSCAWDGSAWQIGGYITWFIDAPPSPGIVPTSMNLLLAQQSGGYGEIFTFRSNGHLGVNTPLAPSYITVNATDVSSGQIAEFNVFSATEYPNISLRKSRGGYGVLSETQDLDYLSEISSWGVNSSSGWYYGSSIAVRQTGAAGATNAPTQMEFYTNNGSGLQFTLTLTKEGNALFGNTADGLTPGGSIAISQDFAHRGWLVGFFNTAPVIQQTGGALVAGGAYTANEQTMLNNIWTALRNYGLLN